MRRRLLESLPRYRVEQVYDAVTRYVEKNLDQLNSFQTTLYVPGAQGNVPLDDLSRYVARVNVTVLQYLGGVYADIALKRLKEDLDPEATLVVHEHGVPIWVALTIPERVQIGEHCTLLIRMYTTKGASQYAGPYTTVHLLAELALGTPIQLGVLAADGGFVVEGSQREFVPDLSGVTATQEIVLEANALGESAISLSFRTSAEKLKDVNLHCTVAPEAKEPITSLRLRFEGDSIRLAGKYAEAEEKYTAAIRMGEDTADVYSSRGAVRHDMAKYESAAADYSAAIKRGASDYWIYIDRGKVFSLQHKYSQAINDFTRALVISPDGVDAYHERGVAFGEIGENELAERDFSAAIEATPTAVLYRNRGLSYFRQGKREQALAEYAKAIAADPGYAPAYRSRGHLYHDQANEELAIAEYSKALELEESAETTYSRGIAYKVKVI